VFTWFTFKRSVEMKSRGMPSLTALLGLLAVAGYQNRDKLADLFRGQGQDSGGERPQQGGLGGVLGNLGGLLGGASAGSVLSGGIGDLVERFKQAGQGEAAESWIKRGPNQQVVPDQLERAIGPEILDNLVQQTGLSRQELLSRLTQVLPEAVDKFTPDGRLPTEVEANRFSQL
jgi:uncharacterized protein YidB (DUF937 family)